MARLNSQNDTENIKHDLLFQHNARNNKGKSESDRLCEREMQNTVQECV